jgi:hypothetical protein
MASNGGMRTFSSPPAVSATIHSLPSRRSASSVRAAGSTNQTQLTRLRA